MKKTPIWKTLLNHSILPDNYISWREVQGTLFTGGNHFSLLWAFCFDSKQVRRALNLVGMTTVWRVNRTITNVFELGMQCFNRPANQGEVAGEFRNRWTVHFADKTAGRNDPCLSRPRTHKYYLCCFRDLGAMQYTEQQWNRKSRRQEATVVRTEGK